ncbi:hypothetical protein AMATHDRAFT_74420 [Amanita thiersii Skay4041]|uniref:Nab2 type CCCH zinc finger 4 domain-containing protein n=1 Tax=Amanita thiersii Skay4041 TaxID=703135 RepID=A0A2A9NMB8_9AGAR|nr:hypothetical protein AMATHDRAFT_74420 [Amanita thiersii Skay4041]
MAFGLTIGTERANALQQSIQDELTKRGYSQDADPVMAEYITIMVINNKTAAQITSELEDLIGTEFDLSFTDWLFLEAAKGAPGLEEPVQTATSAETTVDNGPPRDAPPHLGDSSRRPSNAPRNGVYQQAISQVIPSPTSQKRTASARSPSPSPPNKSRRTDLPTGPRAMQRESNTSSRSLLDRVGGPAGPRVGASPGKIFNKHDDIQARIDNIVNNAPDNNMVMPQGFPGMGGVNGMDMNHMAAANMANPLLLQEMMMNQMALMAQMASSMGMLNTATGQFAGPGFPMQGVMPPNMGMFPGGMENGFQQGGQMGVANGRGRGGGRGRGTGRGRGGSVSTPSTPKTVEAIATEAATAPPAIVAPTPTVAAPVAVAPPATAVLAVPPANVIVPSQRLPYAVPERPQSPTLCKFGLKCTNVHCRYSHPSPVATAESGVVLSVEACDKGKDCKDKDCIKAHVSPAVLNPPAEQPTPTVAHPSHTHSHPTSIPCRFGAACTRLNCAFAHPPRNMHYTQPCKFGAACTRATCPYQHPEGRTLPSTFHRGLSTSSPVVTVQTPETGSMGTGSPHKSVTFNNSGPGAGVKRKLEEQMREIQEKKNEAEKAIKEAEAAASSAKKDDSKQVVIAV